MEPIKAASAINSDDISPHPPCFIGKNSKSLVKYFLCSCSNSIIGFASII